MQQETMAQLSCGTCARLDCFQTNADVRVREICRIRHGWNQMKERDEDFGGKVVI